jgi:enoyl-[acyl-carrier-protein] reductase (NADH)
MNGDDIHTVALVLGQKDLRMAAWGTGAVEGVRLNALSALSLRSSAVEGVRLNALSALSLRSSAVEGVRLNALSALSSPRYVLITLCRPGPQRVQSRRNAA